MDSLVRNRMALDWFTYPLSGFVGDYHETFRSLQRCFWDYQCFNLGSIFKPTKVSPTQKNHHNTKKVTPPKTNMDTQNCRFFRVPLPFPNHHFGYPAVSFRGCTPRKGSMENTLWQNVSPLHLETQSPKIPGRLLALALRESFVVPLPLAVQNSTQKKVGEFEIIRTIRVVEISHFR